MLISRRWKIFAALAGMLVLSMFFRVSMAVVSSELTNDLGLGAAELGVVSGVFFYVFACSQIPLGPLIDRFGGRLIVSILGAVTTGGALFFALSASYHNMVAARILLGIGTAAVLMGSLKIFSNWFSREEFARISGYMIAVGNLGSVVATFPLAYAISNFGWRTTFIAASLAQLANTAAVFLIVRDAPADADIKSGTAGDNKTDILKTWKLLLVSPAFWLVSLMAFFWYANYMVLLGMWGGPYLREVIGLDKSASSMILLCISFGYICGSLLLGQLIDILKGSLTRTIVLGQTILLLMMAAMLGPAETVPRSALVLIFFIIGLASSTGIIIYPLARNLVPHEFAATAMTCVNFFLLIGAAAVQHIIGLCIHNFTRLPSGYPATAYHTAFLIPICGLAGTLVLFVCGRKFFR